MLPLRELMHCTASSACAPLRGSVSPACTDNRRIPRLKLGIQDRSALRTPTISLARGTHGREPAGACESATRGAPAHHREASLVRDPKRLRRSAHGILLFSSGTAGAGAFEKARLPGERRPRAPFRHFYPSDGAMSGGRPRARPSVLSGAAAKPMTKTMMSKPKKSPSKLSA